MTKTGIEWTDLSSNPLRYKDASGNDVWACVKKSAGCTNCYSEAMAVRFRKGGPFNLAITERLTPYVREDELKGLLSPKKTPPGSKVFVADMTDLFGEWVPFELIDRIFTVFALRPDVVFQVLTKRPERMAEYTSDSGLGLRIGAKLMDLARGHLPAEVTAVGITHKLTFGGLPNVWLGCSMENQKTADERAPRLAEVRAAVKFVSAEPLLDHLILSGWDGTLQRNWLNNAKEPHRRGIDWVIVGGESGQDARQCSTNHIRDLVNQCRAAGTPVFVKQLGSRPTTRLEVGEEWPGHNAGNGPTQFSGDGLGNYSVLGLKDRKGGNMLEWPSEIRVREFPAVKGGQ